MRESPPERDEIDDVRRTRASLAAVGLLLLAGGASLMPRRETPASLPAPATPPPVVATQPAPTPPKPPATPTRAPEHLLLELTLDTGCSSENPEEDERALAAELTEAWKTHDATQLVRTIHEQAHAHGEPLDIHLLIAVAAAESAGRPAVVSPTGAAGLYQLMPAEVLRDGGGPLALSADDALGQRAYLSKKPAGDVARIATQLYASGCSDEGIERAQKQLDLAKSLRRDGYEDVLLLSSVAPKGFLDEFESRDLRNAALLDEFQSILDDGAAPKRVLDIQRRARARYDKIYGEQIRTWERARTTLIKRRDAAIRGHFHEKPSRVLTRDPYAAAEALGDLDVRFSPTESFQYFIATLARKREEAALHMGETVGDTCVAPTGAVVRLYNGGLPTLLRIRAGIQRVTENDVYERRVLTCYTHLQTAPLHGGR